LGESMRPVVPVRERRYYVRPAPVKVRNLRMLAQIR
jgi:hypothetical protein